MTPPDDPQPRADKTSARAPRSEEGSEARLVRNTVVNAIGSFAGVIVTLLLTPLLIGKLGTSAYGVWILATTLTFGLGYLSFADLGFEQSAVRYVAEARSAGDRAEINRVFSTSVALLGSIALVLTPPMIAVALLLVELFNVPDALVPEARWAFALVVAQLLFELPTRAFSAMLQGAQRYGVWQLTKLAQSLILSALMAAAVLAGYGIDVLGAATLAGSTSVFLLNALAVRLVVPGARLSRHAVTRETRSKLWRFGSQVFVFRLLSSVYRQLDKTVIGFSLAAASVTRYEIGYKLYAAAALIQTLATTALVPTVAYSRDEPEKLRDVLTRGTCYALASALAFVVAGAVFAEPIIRTWLGANHTDAASTARLLLITLVPGLIIVVGQSMLTALGRLKEMMWILVVWTIANVGLSVALVGPLGVNGVVVATLSCSAVLVVPVARIFLDEVSVSAADFVREGLLPVLPGVVVQVGLGLLLLPLANHSNRLWAVGLYGLATIVAGLAAFVFIGLRRPQRAELIRMVRNSLGVGRAAPAR